MNVIVGIRELPFSDSAVSLDLSEAFGPASTLLSFMAHGCSKGDAVREDVRIAGWLRWTRHAVDRI